MAAADQKTWQVATDDRDAWDDGGSGSITEADPYATQKTSDDDWVTDLHAHMMILVPNRDELFAQISKDPHNGGPWIMWPDTPYAHIMVPIDSYGGEGHAGMH